MGEEETRRGHRGDSPHDEISFWSERREGEHLLRRRFFVVRERGWHAKIEERRINSGGRAGERQERYSGVEERRALERDGERKGERKKGRRE